jgi:two-component system sensor histidine kinase KdpD
VRPTDDDRPDPEDLLREVMGTPRGRRGRLKVFFGYASGVGKSFRMLDEGRRRHERGQDVVVGTVQDDVPPEVRRILESLEVVPLKRVGGGETMDVEAILERHPQVCLVDGLAHDNPPGSRHATRWQDVEELLDAGITVITSVNLQHIEERRGAVEAITSRPVTETVPERFVMGADGLVIVDVPPDLLLQRTGAAAADGGFGADEQRHLSELRGIALLLAAQVVDRQLEDYLAVHDIDASWGAEERLLVCLTPRANAGLMIESARWMSERLHGRLVAIFVRQPDLSDADRARIDSHLAAARRAGAEVAILEGDDAVRAILDFVEARGITQIFIGHSLRRHWRDGLFGGPVDRLIRGTRGVDVRIFPH